MPASHLPVNFFFDLLLLLILTGMGLNVTRFILPGCGGATFLAATGFGLYLFSVTIFALTALALLKWKIVMGILVLFSGLAWQGWAAFDARSLFENWKKNFLREPISRFEWALISMCLVI